MSDDPSVPFDLMHHRIVHNAANAFGGAAVIVPPEGGGESIEILLLDSKGDPAQFWSTVRSRIEIKLAELDAAQRNQTAFGGRR